MKISEEQQKRLEQAYALIADVQIEMLKAEAESDDIQGEWQTLFRIRAELNREIFRLKA